MPAVVVTQRHRNGWQTHVTSFSGGGYSSGIYNVVTQISAMIDARDHQFRIFFQKTVNAQMDAIGRRAVYGKKATVHLLNAQWLMQ